MATAMLGPPACLGAGACSLWLFPKVGLRGQRPVCVSEGAVGQWPAESCPLRFPPPLAWWADGGLRGVLGPRWTRISPSQVPPVPAGQPAAPCLPHQLLHPAGAAGHSPARGHGAVPDPHGDDQGGPEELPGAYLQRARGRRADQGAAWFQQEEGPQERQGEEAGPQGGLCAAGTRTDLHIPRSLP